MFLDTTGLTGTSFWTIWTSPAYGGSGSRPSGLLPHARSLAFSCAAFLGCFRHQVLLRRDSTNASAQLALSVSANATNKDVRHAYDSMSTYLRQGFASGAAQSRTITWSKDTHVEWSRSSFRQMDSSHRERGYAVRTCSIPRPSTRLCGSTLCRSGLGLVPGCAFYLFIRAHRT